MTRSTRTAALVLLQTSIACAQISRTCPASDTAICYSLNIPEASTSSDSGDVFIQMVAPATTHQWVALGQGTGMAGANMFIMYQSADGTNVTVSPRLGVGHVEPEHADGAGAQITMLEGSGVDNGTMTANFRCSNCGSWDGGSMDFTAASASWIYATHSGEPIRSDDLAEDIQFHDDYGVFDWELSTARGGSEANPFLSSASTETTDTGVSSSGGGGVPGAYLIAHAVLACLAVAFVLPIGGILIRVANFPNLIWIHTAIQYLGLAMFIAAFGLGAYYATQEDYWSEHHPIIGTVVFGLMLTQPIWGIMHHQVYKKIQGRSIWSFFHLGVGRVVIILGIINGGLGLELTGQSTGAKIGYGVGAGIMGLAYIASIIFGEARRKRNVTDKGSSIDSHVNGERKVGKEGEHLG